MSRIIRFFAIVGIVLLPISSFAEHEVYYRLLVEEPAHLMQEDLNKEFGTVSLTELNEMLDWQEVRARIWYHVAPEVFRPFSAGARESITNYLVTLTEDYEFFRSARRLYEKYGYPHADVGLSGKTKASLQRPGLLDGFRLGISVDLENPATPLEIITPVPYFACDVGPLNCKIRYNFLSEGLRMSLETPPDKFFGLWIRGLFEHDFGATRNRAELSVVKQIFPDAWVKLVFEFEDAARKQDRFRLPLGEEWRIYIQFFGFLF